MSTIPRNDRRRKSSLLSKARWAGYAAAGAATALGTYEAAEAGVWYSGVLNGGQGVRMNAIEANVGNVKYGIDLPGNAAADDLVMFHHRLTSGTNGPVFGLAIANTVFNNAGTMQMARIAGTEVSTTGNYINAQRFNAGDPIDASRNFFYFGTLAVDTVTSCNFASPGEGYVGFSFEDNGDTRYGWLRVVMDGGPDNGYTIMDYAYAGVGEDIVAGAVPEPGSLGLLATGGIGLLLWRKRRANRKSA